VRSFRRRRPPIRVAAGEKVLAWAEGPEGVVAGTRDSLYVRSSEGAAETRVPWQLVQAADWDQETSVLRISEVGSWGERRPEHRLTLESPGNLLELVRERVTASVVLQRYFPVDDQRGFRVIARRAPSGDLPIRWLLDYDQGVDPDDPEVQRLAHEALEAARNEVGLA